MSKQAGTDKEVTQTGAAQPHQVGPAIEGLLPAVKLHWGDREEFLRATMRSK